MKLSENTLAILKNYSSINPGIVLKPGKKIETINTSSTVRAEALISETIPVEFGIYDLTTFLANVSQMGGKDVEIAFDGNSIELINDSGFALRYFGAEPQLIKSPTKEMQEYEWDVKFTIHNQHFEKIMKIAALNAFKNISFVGEDSGLYIKAFSAIDGNAVSNSVRFRIGDNPNGEFESRFLTENMKYLPLDYNVSLTHLGIAKLESSDGVIQYYTVMQEIE